MRNPRSQEPVPRIAAVHLFSLPLESAFFEIPGLNAEDAPGKSPPLDGRSCAVRADQRGRKVLVDVSAAALSSGVRVGMSQTEAKARLPKLEIKEREPSAELKRLYRVAELLFAFGPLVEVAPPATLFVEFGRSRNALKRKLKKGDTDEAIAKEILHVLERAGHRATIAVSRDPDTARTVAQYLADRVRTAQAKPRPKGKKGATKSTPPSPELVRVVPSGDEKRTLGYLPVTALIWTDLRDDPDGLKRERLRYAHASLRLLGVEQTADLQGLPLAQVNSRLGDAGALLTKRAKGELLRPLRPFHPPDRLVEEIELDQPFEDLEPVLFVLKRIFHLLEARLEARALSTSHVDLTFVVEPQPDRAIDANAEAQRSSRRQETIALSFARPTRRAATMLSIAREKLGGSLPGAVVSVSAEASSPSADRGSQLNLFSKHEKRLEEVGELVARLQAALGEAAVFTPQLRDSHRPEAGWDRAPFDLEAALAEPPVLRPSEEAEPDFSTLDDQGQGIQGELRWLPRVDETLAVVNVAPTGAMTSAMAEPKEWPKPAKKAQQDEPVPPLPPRPLELLEVPEPAKILRNSGSEGDSEEILSWRGRRFPLIDLVRRERLESEWWTNTPLVRDYVVAEVADGRRLWLFYEPNGQLFVHGIFD